MTKPLLSCSEADSEVLPYCQLHMCKFLWNPRAHLWVTLILRILLLEQEKAKIKESLNKRTTRRTEPLICGNNSNDVIRVQPRTCGFLLLDVNAVIWSCVFTVQPPEPHPAATESHGRAPSFSTAIRLALFHGLK